MRFANRVMIALQPLMALKAHSDLTRWKARSNGSEGLGTHGVKEAPSERKRCDDPLLRGSCVAAFCMGRATAQYRGQEGLGLSIGCSGLSTCSSVWLRQKLGLFRQVVWRLPSFSALRPCLAVEAARHGPARPVEDDTRGAVCRRLACTKYTERINSGGATKSSGGNGGVQARVRRC